MHVRHSRSVGRIPSAIGVVARLATIHARKQGVALRPLLQKVGLTAQELADVRTRVPVGAQIELLNRIAEALDDDMLGFHLALKFDLRQGGLFYYVLASSDTLSEVFERGARFTSLVNEGVVQQFIHGRRLGLALVYTGVRRQDDRHQLEFWFTTLLRICRQLTGKQLRPARVRLTHQRAPGHAALARFLGCAVEYGAPRDEFLFDREAGQLPITNADPYLNRLLIEVSEETLARQRRASSSFAARVENAIAPLLPHGKALASKIAADFVMPDLMRIGGVTGWLRAAAIAGAAGLPMSSHLYPEFSAHLLRVTESAHWLEWQDWAYPILAEPFALADGDLVIPDRPGAGIEWDETAVKRYGYDG